MIDPIHDFDLTKDSADALADFVNAADACYRGEITVQEVRDRWKREGWGRHIPPLLAQSLMRSYA